MIRKFLSLMLAAVLVLFALPTALADGQVRPLPIDLTGGAPFKANYRSNPEGYEDPSISVEYHHMQKGQRPDGRDFYYFYAIVTIADASQLQTDWFEGARSVGISGATSTPRWLMEEVKSVLSAQCSVSSDATQNMDKQLNTEQ